MLRPQYSVKNFPLFRIINKWRITKSYLNAGYQMPPVYYYRDKDKREIDLIVEDGDTLYPVKVKMHEFPKMSDIRHFRILGSINGRKRGQGCVICFSENPVPLTEDVMVIPADML
ncbi:MAG: DUF4143 domain-containing protein [Bullifex sp.]